MKLQFVGSGELVHLEIDRGNKQLVIATSKTNYQKKQVPWSVLFDKGKERIQEKITDKLDDNGFRLAVVASMAQAGYSLKPG